MLVMHYDEMYNVSIHVPTRGTTYKKCLLLYFVTFQSTFPRGERHRITKFVSFDYVFQSTFPRGERHIVEEIGISTVRFQSTFPRGERRS